MTFAKMYRIGSKAMYCMHTYNNCWISIYKFTTVGENQTNPDSENALNLRNSSMKCLETNLRWPVSDARGKTGGAKENLWKQVWTGHQKHMRRQN